MLLRLQKKTSRKKAEAKETVTEVEAKQEALQAEAKEVVAEVATQSEAKESAVESEAVESEAVEPETVEPEAAEPETVEPEAVESETVEAETVESESNVKKAEAKDAGAKATDAKEAGAKEGNAKATDAKEADAKETEKPSEEEKKTHIEPSSETAAGSEGKTADKSPKVVEKKPTGKKLVNKKVEETIEEAKSGKLYLDPAVENARYAEAAIENPEFLDLLISALKSKQRRERQTSAVIIGHVAKSDISLLTGRISAFVEALGRPEPQTRWQMLEVLYDLVPEDLPACKKAITGAQDSLYDERSGNVRLAAFKFLCVVGSQDKRTSKKVWPDIDDAIQCYHGDIEFQDMLNELVRFAAGDVHSDVKKQLAQRMAFDSESAQGFLKRRAIEIIEICNTK